MSPDLWLNYANFSGFFKRFLVVKIELKFFNKFKNLEKNSNKIGKMCPRRWHDYANFPEFFLDFFINF